MKRTGKKIQFKCLGTTIKIILVGTSSRDQKKLEDAGQKLKECFYSYQDRLSRFEKSSEICAINQNLGKWISVSPEIKHLVNKSLEFYRASNGIFDPRVIGILEKLGYDRDFSAVESGTFADEKDKEDISCDLKEDLEIKEGNIRAKKRVDFTGLAKGYIVDQATKLVRQSGIENFLIDAGGDMFAKGKNKLQNHWHIAVEGYPEEKLMLVLCDGGIATTGISRKRWLIGDVEVHHLINAKDPSKFDFDLKSVTVVSSDSETADGWAKILFILGRERGIELAEERNVAALFLDKKRNIKFSKEMKPYLNIKT